MLFLNYSIHSRYIRFAKLVSKKSTCNKEKGGSLSTARSGVGKAFAPLPEQVLKVVYAVDMECCWFFLTQDFCAATLHN